jgi:hypothetical protein
MKFTRLAAISAFLAAAAIPAAAFAQVAAGATVYGPDGSAVGTVASVDAGTVMVDTGTYKAPLPENAFGKSDKGPTITVTKTQLDEMMAQQVAAANTARDAKLVAGAAVVSPKGAALGTIKSVDGDAVVLESPSGAVALKREHFALDANGALIALFTAEQVAAAAGSGNSGQ